MAALATYFLLTFAITYACWFAATAPALAPIRWLLFTVGIFAPAIVALTLTARAEGRAGVLVLLRRLVPWRVPVRWYVFAIGFMAAVKLATAGVHRLFLGRWPAFGDEAWYVILAAIFFSVAVGGQTGEEIGWRGYALPRLAARLGLGPASVLLGILWACWHLPLFFIAGTNTTGQSVPLYLASVTAISVAIAWLYAHTEGSLLLAMLLHSAVNQSREIVPSAVAGATDVFALSPLPAAWITVGLLWLCAAYFLLRLSRSRRSGRSDSPAWPAGSLPANS